MNLFSNFGNVKEIIYDSKNNRAGLTYESNESYSWALNYLNKAIVFGNNINIIVI